MPAIVECFDCTLPVLCCGALLRHLPLDRLLAQTVSAVLLPGRALSAWPHLRRRQ